MDIEFKVMTEAERWAWLNSDEKLDGPRLENVDGYCLCCDQASRCPPGCIFLKPDGLRLFLVDAIRTALEQNCMVRRQLWPDSWETSTPVHELLTLVEDSERKSCTCEAGRRLDEAIEALLYSTAPAVAAACLPPGTQIPTGERGYYLRREVSRP